MANIYCIYIHKNKINNKVYIGQTCQKPEYRWNHGKGYERQSYFYSAIQKYGWNNFEHEILKNNLTLEEANYWEEYYIEQYNSTDKKYGYNISFGGNNKKLSEETKEKISKANMGHLVSEETREKISIANKGRKSFRKGISLSEEHRENISKSKKNKKFSDEHKKHLSESHKTKDYINKIRKNLGKKVQCVETGQIFNSFQEAADWAGIKNGSDISAYLSGKQKSAGKHPVTKEKLHWKLIEKKGEKK
jgi:group I intron endonuclease